MIGLGVLPVIGTLTVPPAYVPVRTGVAVWFVSVLRSYTSHISYVCPTATAGEMSTATVLALVGFSIQRCARPATYSLFDQKICVPWSAASTYVELASCPAPNAVRNATRVS